MGYIAINATSIFKNHKTGVEWYSSQLLHHLSQVWKKNDPQVILFAPKNLIVEADNLSRAKSGDFLPSQNTNWQLKPLRGRYFWTQRVLKNYLKRHPPLLLFSPSYISPVFLKKNIPTVTVVHGLEGEYFPEVKTIQKTLSEYLFYLPALKKTSRIIAVSEHTGEDLRHFLGIPQEKITVVPSGPGTLDDERIRTRDSKLPQKSAKTIDFFFIGGSEERKNLETALRIFSSFQKKSRKKCRLFVSGNLKRKNKIVQKILDDKSLNIFKLGYVNEKTKFKYLEKCHFLLYPSFYEGFGFPVLESQACDAVPVVLHGSGVAEIGGKGIIEIDPASQEKDLAVELLKVASDPAKYQHLQELGQTNVQKYNWRKCAEEVRKVLLKTITR